MLSINLNIGGELRTGDVVGISYNNSMDFGWFVESGQYGSLKFISMRTVAAVCAQYQSYLVDPNPGNWLKARFGKGLTYNNFHREYIISYGAVDNRAFKITDPEEFFKGSDLEEKYLTGKQTLNNHKFPAR